MSNSLQNKKNEQECLIFLKINLKLGLHLKNLEKLKKAYTLHILFLVNFE